MIAAAAKTATGTAIIIANRSVGLIVWASEAGAVAVEVAVGEGEALVGVGGLSKSKMPSVTGFTNG